jgi:endonuclease/exonuclease/phosphatase family metal-dependent hydrolase
VRVTTFNILHGRSPSDGRVDISRFAESITSLDSDILALQEVDRDQPRSQGADLTAVAAEAMGAVSHRFVAALSGTPGATWMAATGDEQPGTASYGIALLSRYPVVSWEVVRLPPMRVRVPVLFPGSRRPALAADEPRVGLAAVMETRQGRMTVATTHLSYIPGWNILQLRRLIRALAACSSPLLLLGDLNMAPDRASKVSGMLALAADLTFPAQHPRQQLDHILARGPIEPASAGGAIELPLSDHRALSVDLAL